MLSLGNLNKLMPLLTLSITFSVKSTFTFWYATIISKASRTVFFLDVFCWSSYCKILQISCNSCFILSRQKNYDKFSCLVFVTITGALFKIYLLTFPWGLKQRSKAEIKNSSFKFFRTRNKEGISIHHINVLNFMSHLVLMLNYILHH